MNATEQIAGFEDVPMTVNIELDRRVLTVREVLQLDVNTTLKMDRSAGEIGGALIGFGEIVISETTTGFRITDFNVKE